MKKKWQDKEKRDARDFGGKVTPRSGGFWAFAGDVKTDEFLIDAKQTEKDYYKVSKKVWDKVYNEALMARRTPLLSVEIEGLELVVIDKHDFITLLGRVSDN